MVKENGVTLSLPKGMKQTEIGLLPEDWEVVKLGDILYNYKLGGNYVTTDLPNQFPLIKMGNIGRGKINISKLEYIIGNRNSADLLKYGDLLFNTRNTIELVGKVSIWRKELPEAYYNSNLLKLVFKPQCVSSNFYINAIFNDKRIIKQLSDIATGTTSVAAIYTRDLLDVQIPLPPLPEQETIAEALSDADEWIESLEKLIAKKRLIKKGTTQELLKPKEGWEVKRISEISKVTTGNKNTQDKIESGIYPFFVRSQIIERINSYSFDGEAILTAGDGVGVGKVFHYINGKFDYHQRVYAISHFDSNVSGLYFFKYFQNNFYKRIMQMTAKSSVDSVRMETIADMLIPFPPLSEQTRIANILSDMDAELEALAAQLKKARKIKQGMMQELLTGRIRLV